jgi:ferredoxin
MSLITNRTSENATVKIDYSKCNHCGLCVNVCKDLTLVFKNEKVIINSEPLFGCIGCGQCVAICPNDAITMHGRTLTMEDFVDLPRIEDKIDYLKLYSLLLSRRSVRDFKDKEIPLEIINKILDCSRTAPMGIPPSDVEVLILNGKDKVKIFSDDVIDYFAKTRIIFNKHTLLLMRPFMKKSDFEVFKTFLIPMIDFFVKKKELGEDWLLYGAPLAMYFYNSSYSDSADAYIAATYAMLAGESIGLGNCMIGSISPFLEHSGKKIKAKYGINKNSKQGIFIIFGYPKYKYQKAIKRTFGKVIFSNN